MLVYIWLYTQNTIKCLFWIQTLPFLIENLKDSAKSPKNWTFRSSVTAEKILLKFPLPAPSACSHQGSRRCWQHPPASCHHQGPLRATEQQTGGTVRGKGQNNPNIQPRCAGWGKARPGSTGFTNTEHPVFLSHQCLAFQAYHESLSTSTKLSWWKWATITLCLLRATSQILLSTVHCQVRALHMNEHGIKGV